MRLKFFILVLCFMQTLPIAWAQDKWNEFKGEHFIIYYKTAPMDFIKTVDEMAETYYREITQNLGFTREKWWTWENRAKIYIYDDAQDYIANSQQSDWSHGAAMAGEKIIRTFPSAHGFFDSTLPHELGHIIFREFVGLNAVLPLWFEEGVAMFQEKAKRWGANQDVKTAAKDGSFIPLPDLSHAGLSSSTDKNFINLYYAESASVVYFLITELGEERFVRFCRKLKGGATFEDALQSVYVRFKNVEQLNKSWLKYLGT